VNEKSFRFSVGNLECIALRDATEATPLKDLSPGASRPAFVRTLSAQGLSAAEVTLEFNCLFVRSGKEAIAIDVGWGNCTERLQGEFLTNLHAEGVSPRDVDLVIITHHDRDHVAGIVGPEGALAFPNAHHVMAREGWAWYSEEANLATMPAPEAAFHRLARPLLKEHVVLVQGEAEMSPGIRVIPAPGHQPGHMIVELHSEGERLLHLADTMLHPLFVGHPEWGTGFDHAPEEALATRRRLLSRAASDDSLVFLSHFPFPGLGHVRKDGKAWRWVPLDSPSGA